MSSSIAPTISYQPWSVYILCYLISTVTHYLTTTTTTTTAKYYYYLHLQRSCTCTALGYQLYNVTLSISTASSTVKPNASSDTNARHPHFVSVQIYVEQGKSCVKHVIEIATTLESMSCAAPYIPINDYVPLSGSHGFVCGSLFLCSVC